MFKKAFLAVVILGVIVLAGLEIPAIAQHGGTPSVLTVRQQADLVHKITAKRLETLLPRMMRETGLDMWIISCNEDNLDPIFETMVPLGNWNPITQILVLFDQGPGKGVERLNVARTDTQGLFKNAWDAAAWDQKKGESQWDALGRVVRERDPKRIGLNEGEVQWAAGALTSVLKKKIVEAVGPKYAARFQSAEPLVTLWAETLLEEEVELMERAAALSRSIIADLFSTKMITVGQTTTDDLRWYYWQRVHDLGLRVSFSPFVSIRGRSPKDVEKWGKDDKVVRPGDLLHCDVGLKYMRWNSDHQEMAYVLRPGEADAPETFKKLMAEANRLQDVYCGEFKTGLTGNEILGNVLKKARELGIPGPRVYSHSLGYFLHEPGPLIGLPWEQINNVGRGDVKLVPMSTFVVELSVTGPVPEWGADFRVPLEQDILFDGERAFFLAGRQTAFHLIK
ncbi:MAG: aminopeptidase P family protein [Candidatus Aminicenantes bacterium]|nr:MAG: aminopeptidase P family protein [Candidatus Aminicenantes bacterium]